MLVNIVTIALGVFLGATLCSVLGVCLVMNKKFMTWFIKKYVLVATDIADVLIEDRYED